jgi:hypothetical protein
MWPVSSWGTAVTGTWEAAKQAAVTEIGRLSWLAVTGSGRSLQAAVTKSGRGRGIYMVPILTNKPTSAGGPTWARWPLTLCDTFITLTAFALSFNPMKIKGVTFLGKIKGAATPIHCARQGHLDDACAEL